MEKYNYLLWCINEFMQVEIHHHEFTKALLSVSVDEASVPIDLLKDICTDGGTWPRKAIEALVAGYTKEFLNPDILEESWKRIAELVKQHGQVVNIPVCRMQLNKLFQLYLEVNCNPNEIQLDSEQRYCYQLIETLFSQPEPTPLKNRKLKSTATENEQNPEPGCSTWQTN